MKITVLLFIVLFGFTLALPAKKGSPARIEPDRRDDGTTGGTTASTSSKKKEILEPKKVLKPEMTNGESENGRRRAESGTPKRVFTPDDEQNQDLNRITDENTESRRKTIDKSLRKKVSDPTLEQKEGGSDKPAVDTSDMQRTEGDSEQEKTTKETEAKTEKDDQKKPMDPAGDNFFQALMNRLREIQRQLQSFRSGWFPRFRF